MVELIVTDANHTDTASLADYTLDAAWGHDENSFSLTCATLLPAGAYIYLDGTGETGGVVDAIRDQLSRGGSTLTYTGRTWHGVLAGRVIEPDQGKDYLTVSGDARTVIDSLLRRVGLSGAFRFDPDAYPSGISTYTFDRYVDLYTGLRAMLRANGYKLTIRYDPATRMVLLACAAIGHYGDLIDSDLLDFDANRTWLQVNHLIGLGKGEGSNRAISHWYADRNGNVSQTQTLTGVNEISQTYDYSNAEAKELSDSTRKKLIELQSQGEVRVTVRDDAGVELDVGDTVQARDNTTGITVQATITKKIAKAAQGAVSIEYEAT